MTLHVLFCISSHGSLPKVGHRLGQTRRDTPMATTSAPAFFWLLFTTNRVPAMPRPRDLRVPGPKGVIGPRSPRPFIGASTGYCVGLGLPFIKPPIDRVSSFELAFVSEDDPALALSVHYVDGPSSTGPASGSVVLGSGTGSA